MFHPSAMGNELLIQDKRLRRLEGCLREKQYTLRLYLENIKNYHNVSAILRTADATGVLHVYYTLDSRLPVNDSITCGAHKWILLEKVRDKETFLEGMKENGYRIVVTALHPNAVDFREIDYTGPILIVMGNELDGVSDLVLEEADIICKIPMHGMVQSLNVSVAAALILYEAERQRVAKGMYGIAQIPGVLKEKLLRKWGFTDVLRKKARGRLKHLV